jgi:hypothetical protein
MVISDLTKEVNRTNIVSGRGIYEYGVETNEKTFLFNFFH